MYVMFAYDCPQHTKLIMVVVSPVTLDADENISYPTAAQGNSTFLSLRATLRIVVNLCTCCAVWALHVRLHSTIVHEI